eukprot:6462803-Amphidinium_carterae.1
MNEQNIFLFVHRYNFEPVSILSLTVLIWVPHNQRLLQRPNAVRELCAQLGKLVKPELDWRPSSSPSCPSRLSRTTSDLWWKMSVRASLCEVVAQALASKLCVNSSVLLRTSLRFLLSATNEDGSVCSSAALNVYPADVRFLAFGGCDDVA